MAITRKQFLLGAGAAGLCTPRAYAKRPVVIKLGYADHDNPITKNAALAGQKIEAETKGRIKLEVFPSNELGNDEHMLSGVRMGAIEMMAVNDSILSGLVQASAIDAVGFAFKDAQTAWQALDGKVGEIVCAEIIKKGLYPMRCIWDEGFREVTTSVKPINNPADLKGLKIRVPPSPILVSMFNHLSAAATTLNVSELYSALETKVVNAQENPLSVIESQKFYQVQKYCSLTNHAWSGFWLVAGGSFWQSLPADDRQIIEMAFNELAPKQRVESEALNQAMQSKLAGQGMAFNSVEPAPFRAMLQASGFYAEWKQKFGAELWSALEDYTGPLA